MPNPVEWMMWRSLTVADAERGKEIIISYMEDIKSTGLTLADFYHDDSPTTKWIEIQKELEVRANKSFRLAKSNEVGEPISSS